MDQDAEGELRKLANNEVNYVQLAVDTLNEAIKLEVSKFLESTDQLSKVRKSALTGVGSWAEGWPCSEEWTISRNVHARRCKS